MSGCGSRAWEPPRTRLWRERTTSRVSRNARKKKSRTSGGIFLHTKIVLVYRGYVRRHSSDSDGDEDIVDCRAARRRTGVLKALLRGRSNEVSRWSRRLVSPQQRA